jgi:hypothetical protein
MHGPLNVKFSSGPCYQTHTKQQSITTPLLRHWKLFTSFKRQLAGTSRFVMATNKKPIERTCTRLKHRDTQSFITKQTRLIPRQGPKLDHPLSTVFWLLIQTFAGTFTAAGRNVTMPYTYVGNMWFYPA